MATPIKRPGPPKGITIPKSKPTLGLKTWGAGSSPEEIRSVGKGTSINSRIAESASQESALANLMAERAAYANKNKGNYPSDEQLMKSRKKK